MTDSPTRPAPTLALRPARNEDAQDLFGLLSLCFADYPGCFVDPHDDLRDLREPGRPFGRGDGQFWVLEDERGRIRACVAVDFPEAGTAELHRLYVRPDQRRQGLGETLVRIVEDYGRAKGADRLVFWSDTRFTAAHKLYERMGYSRADGEPRPLGDISGSHEFLFEKGI
ncbi:GNAT family N-acetyltransferase [Microvirga pudoricolor]|uniref:GNAT family N-acetyltransferase n=1 Tax=Microvirga pudoricolor TaxID=2778729 RepID=UPI00194E0F5B|nr:GNAT family N-acetyltransferase [Microvirga pudoricolor]MBM6596425.1 GNAT family N-acetyltransferase [Microvirga pudoricolor]